MLETSYCGLAEFLFLCKRSFALVVRFLVVKLACLGLNPKLDMRVCIYLKLFLDLADTIFSVVGDVSVNSECM
jgi:hypothetical protein